MNGEGRGTKQVSMGGCKGRAAVAHTYHVGEGLQWVGGGAQKGVVLVWVQN